MPRSSQTRAYVGLLILVTVWASFPATAKLAMADFPPFVFGALRCLLGSLFLAAILGRRGIDEIRALSWGDLPSLGFLTFSGIFLSTAVMYPAIYLTTASNTIIIQAIAPVIVALGARLYLGDRLRRSQWTGITCSTLGALVFVTSGGWGTLHSPTVKGDLLVLFVILGWSTNTIYGKHVMLVRSPAVVTAVAYLLSTVVLLPVALAATPFFPPPRFGAPTAWGVVLFQAFSGAVAHLWWYHGVKVVGPSRATIFTTLQPIVGVSLAAALLREPIGPAQIVSGLAVIAGVVLTTRAGRTDRR